MTEKGIDCGGLYCMNNKQLIYIVNRGVLCCGQGEGETQGFERIPRGEQGDDSKGEGRGEGRGREGG